MTDDASPENLRKFLESDDLALVRMGISLAKGLDLKLTATDLVHFLKVAFPPIEDSRRNYVVGKETVKEILTDWLQEIEEIEKVEDTVVEALCNILWNTCPRDDIPKVERRATATATGISAANVYIASAVVEILGGRGNEQAVEPLVKMLQYHEYYPTYGGYGSTGDGPKEIRNYAADALDMLGWKPETDERRAHYLIAKGDWDACSKLRSSAVEPLIVSLGYDEPWDDGKEKSEALIAIGEPAVEPLIEALEGRSWRDSATRHNDHVKVWHYIIDTLGGIGDERAIEPLTETLRDDATFGKYGNSGAPVGKSKAVMALGKIGSVRAIEVLIEILGSSNHRLSDCAIKALGGIGEAAVEPLMKVAKDQHDKDVSKRIKRCLARIEWYTVKNTVENGESWTFEPLIKFLEVDDDEVSSGAAEALGELGDTRAVGPLIEILRADLSTPSPSVNHGVAQALGKFGDARALDIFIQMLQKCGYDEIDIAGEALAKIGEPALDPLIDVVWPDFGYVGYWITKGAAKVLGEIGDARAVEPLIEVLEAECERVQDWYCETESRSSDGCWYRDGSQGFTCQEPVDAIIQIGSKKAIEPLLGALAGGLGGNWWLPGLAAEALTGLGWKPETDEQKASYLIATKDWEGCKETGEPLVTEAVLYLAEPVRVYRGSGVFDEVMEAVNSFGETTIKIFKANECEEALEALGHEVE